MVEKEITLKVDDIEITIQIDEDIARELLSKGRTSRSGRVWITMEIETGGE